MATFPDAGAGGRPVACVPLARLRPSPGQFQPLTPSQARRSPPGFKVRPFLAKTNDGAVVHYQLDRQVNSSTVSVAGLKADVNLTGGTSSSAYDAFVTGRSLHSGRLYWVHVRVVSRSGGIAERVERRSLHRRWPHA